MLLEAQLKVMSRLGIPNYILVEWRKCHEVTTVNFRNIGIKLKVNYQRKSGDVFTFTGNTIVSMIALSNAYQLEKALVGIFGGDDSLVLFDRTEEIFDQSQMIAQEFNL